MAYTAFEDMRLKNIDTYKIQTGPIQPYLTTAEGNGNDLKSAALRFIHNQCEKLNFDEKIAENEKNSRVLQGTGTASGQIPYNMQMEINRLCLERELEHFIDSGVAEDAYNVYYCYLEIFFGRYGKSKKMVELLSEYESNGSSLLMKHRDHYSHSVYVFALGLAIYETNEAYRRKFRAFYELEASADNEAANLFLEFWGLTALFHDIGYPFELPFEQVLSYFEVDHQERGKGSLYLAYRSVEALTGLDETAQRHFERLYGKRFETTSALLAFDIAEKLGPVYDFTEDYLRDVLDRKPTEPNRFGYFMDHAFFSASRLYRELAEELGAESLTKYHVDALSAIILHNSLYKFSIAFYKDPARRKAPLLAELHPLAWMLMLCDELQCWDRTAYGRNSRTELHPMSVDFDFSGGAVNAVYYYDEEEADKIAAFKTLYKAWEDGGEVGKPPRLKAYSDMAEKEQRFTADIEKIVNTDDIPLHIVPDMRPADRRSKHIYLSGSNFLHLYDFAVALHGRNMPPETSAEALESKFASQSLEYQLSGINRAKSFSRYLNALGCFYTDRPVDFEMLHAFTPEQMTVVAPLEHERWVREHQAMGWTCGSAYETLPVDSDNEKQARRALREQLRCHRLAMDGDLSSEQIREHYFSLSEEDQDKDWRPFNSMLKLLKTFYGLRIYKLS